MTTLAALLLLLQDPVYSGPQPGENAAPFALHVLADTEQPAESFDPARQTCVIVFVHEVTRPSVQVLRELDAWLAPRHEAVRAVYVLLTADKIATLSYAPTVIRAANLRKGSLAVSPDGLEGPGAYGLDRKCTLTALVVKEGKVAANFPLLSPTAAVDVPKIKAAVRAAVSRKFATLEEAEAEIRRLEERVEQLEAELAAAKQSKPAGRMEPDKKLPGAAPTDPVLGGALRKLIRSTEQADIDAAVKEIKDHCGEKADLKKQVQDGCTLILHLGYGNDAAKAALRALQEWSKP